MLFVFNNLSTKNLVQKADELTKSFSDEGQKFETFSDWLANYLVYNVIKRFIYSFAVDAVKN